MTTPWFKFYGGEYLSDPKIQQLNGNERSCWITLLSLASQSPIRGKVRFLTEERLLILSGIIGVLPNVLEKFTSLNMIKASNGVVTICNWNKRQMSEGYNRVLKFRKRQRNASDTYREEVEVDIEVDKKSIYGEFQKVKLTPEQHQKLVTRIGEKNTEVLIGELDRYVESLGKDKYKNHYATLLTWASKRVKDYKDKLKGKGKQIV